MVVLNESKSKCSILSECKKEVVVEVIKSFSEYSIEFTFGWDIIIIKKTLLFIWRFHKIVWINEQTKEKYCIRTIFTCFRVFLLFNGKDLFKSVLNISTYANKVKWGISIPLFWQKFRKFVEVLVIVFSKLSQNAFK